ncbi:UNVERIFIED_CONTAM: hypothetical protein Slati_0402000 [Sesamum latifolium]|uniref:Uncharacterized protein n=1 Tax=Sesamum latifolium TaxID=2727402 RepID=A0AAW2XVQ7_9LAMI
MHSTSKLVNSSSINSWFQLQFSLSSNDTVVDVGKDLERETSHGSPTTLMNLPSPTSYLPPPTKSDLAAKIDCQEKEGFEPAYVFKKPPLEKYLARMTRYARPCGFTSKR